MMRFCSYIVLYVSLAATTGCNLYSEIDRPVGPEQVNVVDAGEDGGDAEVVDMETLSDATDDADTAPGELWRALDIEVGPNVNSPIAWKIIVPDGIASTGFGPDGTWLRTFDEEGNPVPRQIESWTTGAHIFWVSVDPGPAPTRRIWIRYGAEPDDGELDSQAIWDAGGYVGAWGFATDPRSEIPDWVGGDAASPIDGEGSVAVGDGRVAVCVDGADGWAVPARPGFAVESTGMGKTFEVTYRADDETTNGSLVSTESLCNGVGLRLADDFVIGRAHVGLNCQAGFDEEQVLVNRPAGDATSFTHVAMTVAPSIQGYDFAIFVNGNELGDSRVRTQNELEAHELFVASFVEGGELSACIDQVHVVDRARSPDEVEAAFRGTFGQNVTIGPERASADFASL